MDRHMTYGVAGYEALLPGELPSEAINVALEFIHVLLEDSKQHGSYGTILRHSKKLNEITVPTILFGFPEPGQIGSIILPEAIANIPLLVVRDKAVRTMQAPTTWRRCVNHEEKVGLSCISLGGKYSMLEAGSFGGWLATDDGRKWGITCGHCLPECDIGSSVVSPSSAEIMARLDTIIPYTKHCPKSRRSVCKLKSREDEVDFLREKYVELSDNDGVELYDGTRVKLVGPDLGILVAKAEHRSLILKKHNEKLRYQEKQELSVKSDMVSSRLDWALFEACNTRIHGNRLTTSDTFTNEKVCGMGLLEPGTTVWKIGRTTNQTEGRVNHVGVVTWEDGFITEEVAIVSSSGSSESSPFADDGDSGALVFGMGDSLEALGLVVAKNESHVPRWVAVTPLWAILEDMKSMTGMDVKFCTEC